MRLFWLFSLLFILQGATRLEAITTKKEILFKKGFGVVTFTGYAPLKDKPIAIYYYIPEDGEIRTMTTPPIWSLALAR